VSVATHPGAYAARFDDRVAATIAEAADASAAFRDRLAAAQLTPDRVDGVAALDRLPLLTKDGLLELQHEAPPFGGLLAAGVQPRRIFQSPGPLYEPDLGGDDPWRWAPALAAAGFGSNDRVLVTFGFHLSPAGAMFEAACEALGVAVLPAGVGSKELQVRACADLGITSYIGTPSYLKALLDTASETGQELAFARAFVTAEPLPPSLRAWLEQRVPVVRQGYGTAETGHLGYECEARDGWHVPEDALVQVCDLTSGVAREDGSEGQLAVTLFDGRYPIVRFGTGDLSAWHTEPCTCDAPTPRLRGWLGRVGDAVKVRGMFLHPRQLAHVMARREGVERYRATVDRREHRDELHVEVVAADGANLDLDAIATAVRDELRFTASVAVVDDLPEDAPELVDAREWD
jgi:phenylacetate-CoA ligase